eukprot:COSAG05_NODE_7849_length_763_cov_1.304217_1_plen_45_part_10
MAAGVHVLLEREHPSSTQQIVWVTAALLLVESPGWCRQVGAQNST